MSANFSVVQVQVKNPSGDIFLYVKCTEGVLGMPGAIDFCVNPWEADRPTLCNDLFERVYHELNNERENNFVYDRVRKHENCGYGSQIVQVHRVDVTRDNWSVDTLISKSSPRLAIQSLAKSSNKIVVLKF